MNVTNFSHLLLFHTNIEYSYLYISLNKEFFVCRERDEKKYKYDNLASLTNTFLSSIMLISFFFFFLNFYFTFEIRFRSRELEEDIVSLFIFLFFQNNNSGNTKMSVVEYN